MPEIKPQSNMSMDHLLGNNHYPSIHDEKMQDGNPFQGTETALPVEHPIPNAGRVPISNAKPE